MKLASQAARQTPAVGRPELENALRQSNPLISITALKYLLSIGPLSQNDVREVLAERDHFATAAMISWMLTEYRSLDELNSAGKLIEDAISQKLSTNAERGIALGLVEHLSGYWNPHDQAKAIDILRSLYSRVEKDPLGNVSDPYLAMLFQQSRVNFQAQP
jgi:hypothetical protein